MPLHLSIGKLFSFFLKLFLWLFRLSMAFSFISGFFVYHILPCSFGPIFYHSIYGCMFCVLLFHFVNYLFLLLCLCILVVMHVLFSWCCSMYCLCVNVYCITATGC